MAVEDLRVMGRATQGVKLLRLNENDEISSVEKIERIEIEEDPGADQGSSDSDKKEEKE